MPLLDLPSELLLQVAAHLDLRDLNSLQRTSRALPSLLSSLFYKLACQPHGEHHALHWACSNGKLSLVKLLIENGADIALKGNDTFRFEPLNYAAYTGHSDIVAYLLDKGADIAAVDSGGRVALYWAIRMKKAEVVRVLLAKGAAIGGARWMRGETPLHTAVSLATDGENRIVRSLLYAGADLSIPDFFNEMVLHRVVRMVWCTCEGQVGLTRLLLEQGADVSARDRDGRTPLIIAITMKPQDEKIGPQVLEVVKVLVEYGADLNDVYNYEKSVLELAAERKGTEVLRWLLEREAGEGVPPEQIDEVVTGFVRATRRTRGLL